MSSEFVAGNLVSWRGGPSGNIGTVTDVDQTKRQLRIRLDSDEMDMTFALSAAENTLDRVIFEPGSFVQSKTDAKIGVVESRASIEGLFVYRVNYPGGGHPSIIETGLRPAVISDPLALLRANEVHSSRSSNLRLTATRLLFDHQFNELSSLSNSRVEIKPHQVGVLHRVVTGYPHRYLLADEVGLGKTIEAGLIIKELKARGVANRVLILAPSGIVSQWQVEMRSKFSQIYSLYRRDTIAYLEANYPGDNVWTLNDNVIASTAFAARDENRQREIALAGWDLVVIDEAHHARRTWQGESRYTETNLYKLAAMLSDPETGTSTGFLLLTATPMQLHRFELYSLIELLDPALFPHFQDFDTHCSSLSGLNRAAEEVRLWTTFDKKYRKNAATNISGWLEKPIAEVESVLDTPSGRNEITEELYGHHRLSEVLIRNRKAVVGGFMPRVAVVWPVQMTDQEWEAYSATTEYVQSGYARSKTIRNNALGFVMAIFQKLNCSSSYALRQSLLRRIEKLEAGISHVGSELDIEDEDIEERPIEDALGDLLGAGHNRDVIDEIREVAKIVQLLDGIKVDSKTQVLIEQLSEIVSEDVNAKVIIFTQFRDTQDYLRRHIESSWGVEIFHGRLNPAEKDEAVRRFRENGGPQIMISTEAGGEGRNFQFCHNIINYDLPWNPMKIEQRIGRLDRLGQKEPVKVINFSILGTIEERVLEVLSRRIRVFEETIGGLDPILGDVENDIKNVFLLATTEADNVLRRMEEELENRIAAAKTTESQLADLIMDTKSFRQVEINELLQNRSSLDNDTMKRFVLGALSELGVNIEKDTDLEGVFDLRLRGRFLIEFPNFARESPLRKVTFDAAVALDYETIEFLAFGHEIVEALVEYVRGEEYRGLTSYRIIVTDEYAPACGWFFIFTLEFEGVISHKELFPVFVDIEGTPRDDLAKWLLDRACQVKREEWGDDISLPPRGDPFEEAVTHAEETAIKRLLKRQSEISITNQERLNLERAKLDTYYEYRQKAAADKLESVRNTLERVSASSDPEVQRIIPVWAKNLENAKRVQDGMVEERERRLARLLGREQVSAQHEIFSSSYIKIVSELPSSHQSPN